MKGLFFTISALIISIAAYSQSDKFTTAMKKNIDQIDSATFKKNFAELTNNFTRIGDAEKTEALPYYYAAYCSIMGALMNEDKSDADGVADKADEYITKAEKIYGKPTSETSVIRSMIATAHMMVDPQARWQQYGAASSEHMETAKKLDPTNPRPYLLEGQNKFYTPAAFGGGKDVAKPILEKALELFNSFQAQTPLDPTWGKGAAAYFLAQCN